MDDIDKIQLKLEGRCIRCKEKLPEHLENCEKHPKHDVLKSVKNISHYLNNALNDIAEKAKDEKTRKQLEELIVKIKK
jgi:hypothetical protein